LGTGEIHLISAATAEGDSVRFPLALGPYETKVVVVGPLPAGVGAAEPSFASGDTLAELGGDWTLDLNGKQATTPLKSWEDLGTPSFAGPATYRKQFTAAGVFGNLRCARLRQGEGEREGTRRARLATLSLGYHQRSESRLQ
jgi:hypothetical protein